MRPAVSKRLWSSGFPSSFGPLLKSVWSLHLLISASSYTFAMRTNSYSPANIFRSSFSLLQDNQHNRCICEWPCFGSLKCFRSPFPSCMLLLSPAARGDWKFVSHQSKDDRAVVVLAACCLLESVTAMPEISVIVAAFDPEEWRQTHCVWEAPLLLTLFSIDSVGIVNKDITVDIWNLQDIISFKSPEIMSSPSDSYDMSPTWTHRISHKVWTGLFTVSDMRFMSVLVCFLWLEMCDSWVRVRFDSLDDCHDLFQSES